MRETLTEDECRLINLAISNPQKYSIQVDNDDVYVLDVELDEIAGDFYLYGQEMIVALLKFSGANAEFV